VSCTEGAQVKAAILCAALPAQPRVCVDYVFNRINGGKDVSIVEFADASTALVAGDTRRATGADFSVDFGESEALLEWVAVAAHLISFASRQFLIITLDNLNIFRFYFFIFYFLIVNFILGIVVCLVKISFMAK